ncbi:MAG: PIN domain-containing protein [Gemmatimonadota bacterium]
MIRLASKPIHLDTSFLIRALTPDSPEAGKLRGWLQDGRSISMSAFAWGEFLCGPLEDTGLALAHRLVKTYVPVGAEEAAEAAHLFNLGGRRRGSFPDCVIAATAIRAGAELATSNVSDFKAFQQAGLHLAD